MFLLSFVVIKDILYVPLKWKFIQMKSRLQLYGWYLSKIVLVSLFVYFDNLCKILARNYVGVFILFLPF
jgi:hypothetical protein